MTTLLIVPLIFFFFIMVIIIVISLCQDYNIKEEIEEALENNKKMEVNTFFELRNHKGITGKYSSNKYNVSGIYILHNETKNMYYVGQSKNIFSRVNSHFTGKGNGDVYADYKYGDNFSIQLIKYSDSNFKSLNEMEWYYIKKFDCVKNGYNKSYGTKRG